MAKNQQLASIDICHLASAHERNDTRIGLKMARSALDQGLSVAFVVADDGPDETRNGMRVVGVKRYRRRLLRMLFGPISVYRAALRKVQRRVTRPRLSGALPEECLHSADVLEGDL